MIYLVTVNFHSSDLIAKLLDSIQAPADLPYRLVIVNNSPAEDSLSNLAGDFVTVLNSDGNVGFGAACNRALTWVFEHVYPVGELRSNRTATVWLLNPDTCLTQGALEKAATLFENYRDCSIVGTVITKPNGAIWFAGGRFVAETGAILAENLFAAADVDYAPCDWVSACSLLINLSHFQTCPQFDDRYFLYYEDFDFCRRYHQQGHSVGVTRLIQVIHQPSSITNRNLSFKYQHSTYSYLLTLKRYTNTLTFSWRLLRLVGYAFLLAGIKPAIAIGKLRGVLLYFQRVHSIEASSSG